MGREHNIQHTIRRENIANKKVCIQFRSILRFVHGSLDLTIGVCVLFHYSYRLCCFFFLVSKEHGRNHSMVNASYSPDRLSLIMPPSWDGWNIIISNEADTVGGAPVRLIKNGHRSNFPDKHIQNTHAEAM